MLSLFIHFLLRHLCKFILYNNCSINRLVFPEYYNRVEVFELVNDIFFIIDACLSFFKIYGDNRTLSQTSWHYFRGYFIFDFLSVFPGLVGNKSQNFQLYIFKLTRFVHTNRLFRLFSTLMNKFLLARGYNIMKVRDYVDLVTLFLFVFFATHLLACFWCFLGRLDYALPTA